MTASDDADIADRLAAAVEETLDSEVDWKIEETADAYRLTLPDRVVLVSPAPGPGDAVHWEFSVRSDGAVVGKYGLYESLAALGEALRSALVSDVGYTVCCDG